MNMLLGLPLLFVPAPSQLLLRERTLVVAIAIVVLLLLPLLRTSLDAATSERTGGIIFVESRRVGVGVVDFVVVSVCVFAPAAPSMGQGSR